MKIALVSCCGPKLPYAAPAQELYCSPFFRFSKAWAERYTDAWLILSAKHKVIRPEEVLEPYDQRVPTARAAQQAWADAVSTGLAALVPDISKGRPVVFVALTGEDYLKGVNFHPHRLERPFAGLKIGKRLQQLKSQLAGPKPVVSDTLF